MVRHSLHVSEVSFLLFIDMKLNSLTVCSNNFVQFDIEEFATKHLNDHRKGFLGKLLPVESVLTWSKVSQSFKCRIFNYINN